MKNTLSLFLYQKTPYQNQGFSYCHQDLYYLSGDPFAQNTMRFQNYQKLAQQRQNKIYAKHKEDYADPYQKQLKELLKEEASQEYNRIWNAQQLQKQNHLDRRDLKFYYKNNLQQQI